MDEEPTTYVFDASDLAIGRLSTHVAKILLNGQKNGTQDRVIVTNAENAIVSGSKKSVFATYRKKYELNHARKGPFFPRMPDKILKRTVRGMLPYQKKSSGRAALRNLRVVIGCPSHLQGDELPEGHELADMSKLSRPLPLRFVRLGKISENLGAPMGRVGGDI
ncbi:MAG: 50S ribosomal protein L13 [Euryarchaeota archaeon]|nr:50S ribosomal protein L13 [Euryarchaeota archaeon]